MEMAASSAVSSPGPFIFKDHGYDHKCASDCAVRGPYVQFAHFDAGKLRLLKSHTRDLEYIAISHVWGSIKWRSIPGIDGEFLVSDSKADFIANQLPSLVGSSAFWMDTLTVNQRNQIEVIATVQSIPAIFRHASRTIAVREDDGIYECCAQVLGSMENSTDFLQHNCAAQSRRPRHDSYLQRLWTLQECLLSHTIEFVIPHSRASRNTPSTSSTNRAEADRARMLDSLLMLSNSFSVTSPLAFIHAYASQGTIRRPKPPVKAESECLHTDDFCLIHQASNRSATMPRDYVFATMPQFPWYQYPQDAAMLSFSDIFVDLHDQASRNGFPFACRFRQSMMHSKHWEKTSTLNAWLPSKRQPEPTCLGDFLKLLGGQLLPGGACHTDNLHVTKEVRVFPLESPDLWTVFDLVTEAMQFSPTMWYDSYDGGELSKYGIVPPQEWHLDDADATANGWIRRETGTTKSGTSRTEYDEWEPIDGEDNIGELDPKSPSYMPLFHYARTILSNMFFNEISYKTDPDRLRKEVEMLQSRQINSWTEPLLRTLLLQAAMVICRVPLSATSWVNRFFVPVRVDFGELKLLGLRARHASKSLQHDTLCVGQHLPTKPEENRLHSSFELPSRHPIPTLDSGKRNKSIGADLVLVNNESLVPTGLLPDFCQPLMSDEDVFDRMRKLYSSANFQGVRISPLRSNSPFEAEPSSRQLLRGSNFLYALRTTSSLDQAISRLNLLGQRAGNLSENDRLEGHRAWMRVIETYSSRNLSDEATRKTILEGALSSLKKPQGLSFAKGLCLTFLPWSLLWRQLDSPSDQHEIPTPSWSCTFRKGTFDHGMFSGPATGFHICSQIRFCENLNPRYPQGLISISGFVSRAAMLTPEDSTSFDSLPRKFLNDRYMKAQPDSVRIRWDLDISISEDFPAQLFLIMTEQENRGYGLVLCNRELYTENNRGIWARVGVFSITSDGEENSSTYFLARGEVLVK